MSYQVLVLQAAQKAYEIISQSAEPNWPDLEALRGSGPPRDYYHELRDEIDSLSETFEFPLGAGAAAAYEGRIGVVLHENITDPEAVSDPDFWRWVAFRPLREATLYRHQDFSYAMPHGSNFGLGSLLENFPYRAWMRAEIGYDPEATLSKRYDLALRGDQDLWRSHLIRVRYSFHREMAHALIEFQYPNESSAGTLKKGDKADGIRMLAKRLQRTQANTAYPALSKDQCRSLIEQLANGLTQVDGTQYMRAGVK